MVHYHIHYHVHFQAVDRFVTYLREEAIPEMLKQPGFLGAELLLNKGGALVSSGKDVKVVYRLQNETALKDYMASAMDIRQKAVNRFPGEFSAHREVWLESISF